jgi:predicted peroxiredoxin
MKSGSLVVFCTHGTYGRNDDLYGALLLSNASLAKGLKVSLIMTEDGVYACKKNQQTNKIGYPNNLDEINDFIELGGKLLVDEHSLQERGLSKDGILENSKVIGLKTIEEIVCKNSISLTF